MLILQETVGIAFKEEVMKFAHRDAQVMQNANCHSTARVNVKPREKSVSKRLVNYVVVLLR